MLHNVVTTIQGTHKLEYREEIIKESKDGSNGSYINWLVINYYLLVETGKWKFIKAGL